MKRMNKRIKKQFMVGLFLICLASISYVWARNQKPHIEASGTMVRLYRHANGQIIVLPLEEYVMGVVAAEMPAAYPMEALKAQAVAARTYILRRLQMKTVNNLHAPGADICDDFRHGQAYLDAAERRQRWGVLSSYEYEFKVRRAVESTRGEILVFNGELIEAVYHASCGGKGTENAGDVWALDLPYLRAVDCQHDGREIKVESKDFTWQELGQRLHCDLQALPAAKGGPGLIAVIDRTPRGRPKTIRLGNQIMLATALRDALELRSTDMEITVTATGLHFTTRGYGHAVGMCQEGAAILAEKGYDYAKILQHYYPGTQLAKY